MSAQTLKLGSEEISAIRHALLIGLESFGELERVIDEAGKLKLIGQQLPDEITPIHPTGLNDTISGFVSALRYLEQAENAG